MAKTLLFPRFKHLAAVAAAGRSWPVFREVLAAGAVVVRARREVLELLVKVIMAGRQGREPSVALAAAAAVQAKLAEMVMPA